MTVCVSLHSILGSCANSVTYGLAPALAPLIPGLVTLVTRQGSMCAGSEPLPPSQSLGCPPAHHVCFVTEPSVSLTLGQGPCSRKSQGCKVGGVRVWYQSVVFKQNFAVQDKLTDRLWTCFRSEGRHSVHWEPV